MKIVIALIFLFTVSQVSCFAPFDFVSSKFNEVANSVVVTFNGLKHKVKNFFLNTILYDDAAAITTSRENNDFREYPREIKKREETMTPVYANTNFDPSVLMSTPQLATFHGKRIESHVVHTGDGYLLTLHRLPVPSRRDDASANKTVLLHHGLLGSSVDWILLGPDKSLPYLLSNAGYDVWLANARGNIYSKGHTTYKVNSREFWNFTWQEIGEQDLPASLEYIRAIKNTTEPINYIGHSIGTSAFLVLLSALPRYNEYFRVGILLAPLVFMSNAGGPIRRLGFVASNPSEKLFDLLGRNDFFPERVVPEWLAQRYCRGPMLYCANPLFFLSGTAPNFENWNSSFVSRLLYHIPAGTSTNTILHYAQVAHSGKFHKYRNSQSQFPLSKVTVPIALISSSDDPLATVADVIKLYSNIGSPIDNHIIRHKNVGHSEFVWGAEADTLVFDRVLEYLENKSSWKLAKNNEINGSDIF